MSPRENARARKNMIIALLLLIAGFGLLNWGSVILGLLILGGGVYMAYRALPSKAS